jgi:enamine deaminase RidA (YjgF/YER057c/UK114 family)
MSDQFPVLNKVWNEFFRDVSNPPVRTTVAVKELPGLNLVEMKVIATTELAK